MEVKKHSGFKVTNDSRYDGYDATPSWFDRLSHGQVGLSKFWAVVVLLFIFVGGYHANKAKAERLREASGSTDSCSYSYYDDTQDKIAEAERRGKLQAEHDRMRFYREAAASRRR